MRSSDLFPTALLKELGILEWGYTEESKPTTYDRYESWVSSGHSSPLGYLSDHRKNLREDIKNIFPQFQSALVFLFSYQAPKKWLVENEKHQVAAYSLGFEGEDYHHHLKRKLELLSEHLKKTRGDLEVMISLDAQPVLERDLAHRAGLGWFGKNSMLIHQREGSYFLIGSLLLDTKLNEVQATVDTDHCGQCLACVEACPTQAIDPINRTLTANKCISTFTIEMMKDVSPPVGFEKSRGEVFGCDICQDVCPWNKKVMQRVSGILNLRQNLSFLRDWLLDPQFIELRKYLEQSTNRGFKKKFFGTAFDRPGKVGWLKNFKALKR